MLVSYEDIFEIIDHRWNIQLRQLLHVVRWYLNPAFFYKATSIDPEVKDDLYDCIEKLVQD